MRIEVDKEAAEKKNAIKDVKTPLAFFTLVVSVVEGILGYLATKAGGYDFTILLVGIIALAFALVGIVAWLAYKSPQSFLDKVSSSKPASSGINPGSKDEMDACQLQSMSARGAISKPHGPLRQQLLERLDLKLSELQKRNVAEPLPFALLGSTYLDFVLGPVGAKRLEAEEWANLDDVRVTIGGSAMCVGRYLWTDYKHKSCLFTPFSQADDFMSREFRNLIEEEKASWLIDGGLVGVPNGQTPITTLLVQSDRSYATMFTHPGALASFGWKDVQPRLGELLSKGGFLYISGFMKTNLATQLTNNLQLLHSRCLVCLDHGRLNPSIDSPKSVRSLHEAFLNGLVDVYICTFNELLNFWRIATGKNRPYQPDQMREALEDIASVEPLPPVTIVRNSIGERSIAAFVAVGESVDPITDNSRAWLLETPVAPQNAFNAAIMHYLATEPRKLGVREHVIEVGQKALQACHQHRKQDRSRV